MLDRGFLPDEVTYNSMMNSLCKQGQSKEAHNLFDLMVRRGIKPDIISYQMLLLGYATDGTATDVKNILDSIYAVK